MTESRSFTRTIIRYVTLQSISFLGLSVYILADTFFISQGVGSQGLTALNLVLPVYSLISGLGLLFGVGGATVFAIYTGGGQPDRAGAAFTTVLIPALALGGVIALAGGLGAGRLAALLGAGEQVLEMASTYLGTICLFAPAFMANQVLTAFVRNDGEPGRAMAGMLAGSMANIALDWVLIFPLGLGMRGAAVATCLAPVIGIAIQLGHFRRGRGDLRPTRPRWSLLAPLSAAGAPGLVTELSSGMVLLLFNYTILGLEGDLGVAAYGIVANLALVVAALFTGVAQGIQPAVSHSYGAGRGDRVRYGVKFGCVLAAVLGGLFLLGGYFGADTLAALFDRDGDTRLTDMAARGIRLYFTAFPLMGLNIVATAALAAVARSGRAMALSLLRGLALPAPGVWLLAALGGMTGVWLAVPAVEAVTAVFSVICLASLGRKSAISDGTHLPDCDTIEDKKEEDNGI